MIFEIGQKVLVRKTRVSFSEKPISLNEWITRHCFSGEVLDVQENAVKVCKLNSQSLYGKGDDREILSLDVSSDEYDVQPLRTPPLFQPDPMAITMVDC